MDVDIIKFLTPNTYIICVVLFIIGMILKQTPSIKNWMIPYLVGTAGVVLCNFLLNPGINATIQGILAAGFTVYSHQLGKQGAKFFGIKTDTFKEKVPQKHAVK